MAIVKVSSFKTTCAEAAGAEVREARTAAFGVTTPQPLPKPVLDKANELARLCREHGLSAAVEMGSGLYRPLLEIAIYAKHEQEKTNDRDE